VGITGTMEIGLPLAVALAILRGDPTRGCAFSGGVTADDVVRAKECVQAWAHGISVRRRGASHLREGLVETDRGWGGGHSGRTRPT
jgi:hypothetical protein